MAVVGQQHTNQETNGTAIAGKRIMCSLCPPMKGLVKGVAIEERQGGRCDTLVDSQE